MFNFFANDDDAEFSLVDNKPAPRTRFGGRGRFKGGRGGFMRRNQTEFVGGDVGQGASRERARQQRMQSKKSQQWNTWAHNRQQWGRDQQTYSSSVDIRPDWAVLEQIQLAGLTKMQHVNGEKGATLEAETLAEHGSLRWFDKSFDRLTPKLPAELQKTKLMHHRVTTSEDPTLCELAEKNAGNVLATGDIVAAIMCAARSVYGWDLVVTKKDGKLFFDKSDEGNFDMLTVSETGQELITDEKDNINGVPQLSAESTAADHDYSQQALDLSEKPLSFGSPSPLAGDDAAPVGYRYRKWAVAPGITLVARCEFNGVVESKGSRALLQIRALTEYDSKITGVDWRQKIETQRGAVIATELNNNANKLAKWTCHALLAGADQMKLGFVTRTHPKDPGHHEIVNTQTYKPKDFAQQINLTEGNMWGVFKSIVESCMKMEDGKYLLVKDPNKPIIRTYEVPSDAFEDDYADEPLQ